MPNSRRVIAAASVALVALILCLTAPTATRADVFPLQPDFSGTLTPAGWVLGGDAALTAAEGEDPAGQGWLRLTEAAGNRHGYAYYDVAFPSDRGLVVTFDFAAWGGSGADGTVFFLFDGDTTAFAPGGYGGSLGYAQRSGIDGLTNAYLGVGIDEFGNFSQGNEGRNGGPGFRRNAIAVRGPGNARSGYAYVAGTGSLRHSLDFPRIPSRPNQGSDRFRRIEIRLEPGPGGYTVEVLLQEGARADLEQVIPPTSIGQDPPATLKMGFAASTGGATNYHEIRNLSVTATDTPTELGGTITETAGGQPLAGASITVVDAEGHTLDAVANASGQWSISSEITALVAGSATVTARHPGYCPEVGAVNIAKGVPNTRDLALDPATLGGVVTDAATNVPLAGVTVVLTDAIGVSFTTTTSVDGEYAFSNTLAQPLATGSVSLSGAATGYATATLDTTMTDCGPNAADLALDTSDIWFFKSDGRATASAGETLTYTLVLENRGSIAAEGIVVVDELLCHEHVEVLGMTPGAVQVGHVMTWTLPSPLDADASTSITVAVRISDALPDGETVLANYAHALVTGSPEADMTSNEQSDLTTVTAHPNLTLAKTAETETTPVGVNQLITYTLTGDNRGDALATGVTITDALDGLVTYVPGSAVLTVNGMNAPVTVTQTAPDLVFSLPDIPPGMAGDLAYTLRTSASLPPGTQAISNTATVTLDQQDYDPSNNSDDYGMPAQAFMDLHVDKVAIPEFYPARPGGMICTQVRYANYGTTAASQVTLTDALPALASYVLGSLHVNGAPAADPPIAQGVMDLSAVDGSLGAARYEGVISYTMRITDALGTGVTAITNTATISDGVLADAQPANNQGSAVTPIEAIPDLQVDLDDALEVVQVGDTITWTVAFRNVGDQAAANVALSVTLGEGVSYVPGSASDAGAYNDTAHAVVWNLPVMAAGQALSYTLQATVDETISAGALAFCEAEVTDDGTNGAEPTPGDNNASDTDRIVRPFVVMSKAMSDDAELGQPVTFTLAYRNYSVAPGLNVSMTDTLPAYLDFVDASGAWSRDGETIVWDLGTVGSCAQGSVTMTAMLSDMPDAPQHAPSSLGRPLVPMRETITSTLTPVESPWYSGSVLTPTVRVLWQDDLAVGPKSWNTNPRLPGAATFSDWPAPVAAGIEPYWLDEANLGAQWIAHDPAGQVDANYSFFRHIFYLPINICQPQIRLDIAADDLAEAFVNGVYVGQDYGGGGATALVDVKGIQAGANLLAVRLLNNDHGGHTIYSDPQGRFMCHPGVLYRLEVDYQLRPFVMAPAVVRAGDPLTLTLNEAVLAGEPPYALSIDYGDGLAGTSATTHVYAAPGTYSVTVQATDALGQIGRDVFAVNVHPAYSHLVVNNVALTASSGTHAFTSQAGAANETYLGLEQVLTVLKTLVAQSEQADGSQRLSFQVEISSTRPQIDGLPLFDGYDPEQMTLVAADPEPDSQPYPGLAVWDDLTGPAPHGFGRALEPGAPMVVSATFVVDPAVSGVITNTAWVAGALDQAGLLVNDGQADAVLDLARPSAVVAPPMAWGDLGVFCAGWRQSWTLTATNDGDRVLTGVSLTASISDTLAVDQYDIVWAASSPGMEEGRDGEVVWRLDDLAPGESVERTLVLRPYSSVAPGTVVEICARLDSDQFASEPACAQGEIARCEGPTPSPPEPLTIHGVVFVAELTQPARGGSLKADTPIEGAVVTATTCVAGAWVDVTNADGEYSVTIPGEVAEQCNEITLEVYAEGYGEDTGTWTVAELRADGVRDWAFEPPEEPSIWLPMLYR